MSAAVQEQLHTGHQISQQLPTARSCFKRGAASLVHKCSSEHPQLTLRYVSVTVDVSLAFGSLRAVGVASAVHASASFVRMCVYVARASIAQAVLFYCHRQLLYASCSQISLRPHSSETCNVACPSRASAAWFITLPSYPSGNNSKTRTLVCRCVDATT